MFRFVSATQQWLCRWVFESNRSRACDDPPVGCAVVRHRERTIEEAIGIDAEEQQQNGKTTHQQQGSGSWLFGVTATDK